MIQHAARRANLCRSEESNAAMAAASSSSSPLVVRAKRELLASRMTCPICKKLLRDATTISECLHTFCRKCIFEKLNDEEVDCCPICNIDLGCVPVEKLRADHNLQDIRAKIFPFKRKVNAPEVSPSITLPVRRKERSLSSLVVNTPRVAAQPGLTGRRTKVIARRASSLRGLGPIIEEPRKEDNNAEDHAENSRRQMSSNVDPSDCTSNKNSENAKESSKDKSALWKLVEAANRTKAVMSGPQTSGVKEEQNGTDNDVHIDKIKDRVHLNKSKIQEENNSGIPVSPLKIRARRLQGRKKRELETSAQALIDAAAATREKRNGPIWLALVPLINQNGDPEMPQTSACYLRIKDGNLPVSFVQKYLVKKHNLASEYEVEIKCRDQTVNPTLPLHNLADIWLQSRPPQRVPATMGTSRPPQRVPATMGTSAKDFVLVLNYSRKFPAP